jgi:ABC-type antimicrobial peptide transport system permease subunit
MLAGVLVATTGFTVLTGATATARLEVTGTVGANARAAYDILVRPKGARTSLESDPGLVRPNYLSGQFGGITMGQYRQIQQVSGVDVAAPIAMVGYVNTGTAVDFDVTSMVDRSRDEQIIRVDPTFTADRGLSRASGEPSYVYVTKHRLSWPEPGGTAPDAGATNDRTCGGSVTATDLDAPGGPKPICTIWPEAPVTTDRATTTVQVVRLRPDGSFESFGGTTSDRLTAQLRVNLPLLLAGIDPPAEERLVGLAGAIDAGRYLAPTDTFKQDGTSSTTPVLASSQSYVDAAVEASFSRLSAPPALAGMHDGDVTQTLAGAPTSSLGRMRSDEEATFQGNLGRELKEHSGPGFWGGIIQTGSPQYDRAPDGSVVPRLVPPNPDVYQEPNTTGLLSPWQGDDASFRTLVKDSPTAGAGMGSELIGTFDPAKLTGFSELSRVPMETYQPPGVTGADERSTTLLGGRSLQPDGNPGGYLSAPPLLLTNLAGAQSMLSTSNAPSTAPISAVRIRVAGVTGFTKASRERVRLVAERIATATGLDVDIAYGSSAAPQTVQLAKGVYGRPALRLTEGWTKKGVAAAIVNAVDRKSAVLFLLVLVVCALFLLNAVSAAVRDRREELAVLACLGWPGRRIGLTVLAEVLTVGLVAGLLGLVVTVPLGALLHVGLSVSHALLALPVAVGLALVAGVVPAVRASRAHPADALRPPVRRARRPRHPRGLFGLALINVGRVPGRTLLGAVALAVGIAALTMLVAVTFAFRGAIVGTVLGDAVSLRVRGVDTVAVVATVLLGAFAIADVLYLGIRDRLHELASLRAAGWSDAALGRLVTYEGLCVGVLGAIAGAGAGLVGAGALVGSVPADLVADAALTGLAGVLIAGLSALVPALLLRHMPIARLLAEE